MSSVYPSRLSPPLAASASRALLRGLGAAEHQFAVADVGGFDQTRADAQACRRQKFALLARASQCLLGLSLSQGPAHPGPHEERAQAWRPLGPLELLCPGDHRFHVLDDAKPGAGADRHRERPVLHFVVAEASEDVGCLARRIEAFSPCGRDAASREPQPEASANRVGERRVDSSRERRQAFGPFPPDRREAETPRALADEVELHLIDDFAAVGPVDGCAYVVELGHQGGAVGRQAAKALRRQVVQRKHRQHRMGVPLRQARRLAGIGQPLERIQPRRLEHPVARHGLAFGHDERLVDECAQVLEHIPGVDRLVVGDKLCRLQREAADEDADASEDRLFLGAQQAMAPFERGSQRLMPAQDDPRPGRQNVEPFPQT